MKFSYYLLALLFKMHLIAPISYLYPVASCHNDSTILFIQQKNRDAIQLLTWDSQTGHMQEILWSLFTPGNIHILPDETGFSFIDNGRLRIQYFNRRSPKTIDFDYCFYGFNTIQWLNNSEFCCSAQTAEDHYALFHCFIDGSCCCIEYSKTHNYLFPQKIATDLFYIAEQYGPDESSIPTFSIMQCTYPDTDSEHTVAQKTTTVFEGGNKPIAFLTMTSKTEGFFIEHPRTLSLYNVTAPFSYYLIKQIDELWTTTLLFTFFLPVSFFTKNDKRLHESLLPLVPKVIENSICFVDASHSTNNELEFFVYEISTSMIQKNDHIFTNCFVPVPLYCLHKLVFGGAIGQPHLEPICFLT